MVLRLDKALVARGLAVSRMRAQALIDAGSVTVNGITALKSNVSVQPSDSVALSEPDHPWVSRGGLKLAGAIKAFNISFKDKTVLDIGASTGGFTDVALHHGAIKVFAVDVGHDQLAKKLREDTRVCSLEGVNARDLTSEVIDDPIDILVCDASFISLKKVLPAGLDLVRPSGEAVVLIKPQFEVGKGRLGKGGVVKSNELREEVCHEIHSWFNGLEGWIVGNITTSPIKGPRGNVEYLLHAKRRR